ncbi:hypothetical protein NS184_07805 [Curtobacterium luteum]|uniref:Uncharacterized protein n=1 Tax=Curtobacterium luteum TaxID=33881 RepID=A0A175RTN3_9MICO|nr:hypothetical protein NS184_07805 [Curtobacterium luteum]
MTDVPNEDRPTPQQPAAVPARPKPGGAPGAPVSEQDHEDFAARTAAAEDLDVADRADAFAALHDELRTRLESGGTAGA